jgi:RNA 2',3'-cyclic 3'-phosphodiesterase
MIRAFIAVEIPVNIHTQLEHILLDLKRQIKGNVVRWVPSKNIHITLKFLGNVTSENLPLITTMLLKEVLHFQPFTVDVEGIGAFPSMTRPKVIWIGIRAPETLLSLQRAIEIGTSRLGYEPEGRPFSPHLTLGRLSQDATREEIMRIGSILVNYKVNHLGDFMAKEIWLFKSDLLPGGAVYTPLFNTKLGLGDHAIESI